MFDVWKNVLEEMKHKVSHEKFLTYLQETTLEGVEDGVAKIGVKNIFMSINVKKNFNKEIIKALNNNGVEVKSAEYIVKDSGNKVKKSREVISRDEILKTTERKSKPTRIIENNPIRSSLSTGLIPEFNFDNFVVGTNNDVAVYTAKMVVKDPGGKRNPFFLYGKSGVGKTHLVQAIGNELLKQNPKLKVLYVPINRFYSDFIDALKANKPEAFTKKYYNLDVLIVDDFQMIIGKDKSQDEFFNLFNEMYLSKRQIIVTCDRLPDEIKDLDVRLSSRLTQSGAYDIQLPSFEDKCAILQSKAEFDGVEIEREAIEYIAENVKTNVRDLNSEYEKLIAFAELRGMSPLQIISSGYTNTSSSLHKNTTTPKKIISTVAKYYEMPVSTMLSKSRVAHIKNARQVAMYLMQNELGLSTTKTAHELGMKDHTTVMNGVRRINSEMKMNFKLREEIGTLRETIYE
ncbi:chromosomal replication initiator protein DnaA [Candidatus Saccharibacteria bacterium]|nr:chromosomal replication initiator protein DnaA [Candidatus Saccharibacteria bacterium]